MQQLNFIIFKRFILTKWYVKNDISGVVYIVMDSEGAWEFKIAKEMEESEYQIDLNKIL
ncbi:TPA: hypothetical protein ACJHGG_003591 [Clostridioides difficile]|uniref:hypothetical protein n=1 Tax=Clostridioides difficile TaxID=1496 RepID=UPI00190EB847|nr:hypothetical protein [Clostridioides difficile]MDV9929429.1 hypothetical protein [Clostridioides difficile]HBE8909438.1 hypothetical protein [Clostridioides difficile]HBF2885184.1 hypothetical protein [Clostridioides difficile]HBF6677248.1 hypothetical protein [Clostridioides difficile]HBG3664606.1 hypothetical protein [Clostridioides difficile]